MHTCACNFPTYGRGSNSQIRYRQAGRLRPGGRMHRGMLVRRSAPALMNTSSPMHPLVEAGTGGPWADLHALVLVQSLACVGRISEPCELMPTNASEVVFSDALRRSGGVGAIAFIRDCPMQSPDCMPCPGSSGECIFCLAKLHAWVRVCVSHTRGGVRGHLSMQYEGMGALF